MKVDTIEHERNRYEVRRSAQNYLYWGDRNDYPQSVIDIVGGSYTGTACLDVYQKFIGGSGFADADNYQIIINSDGETADGLLYKISEDYALLGGFAIHVNRNYLGQIVEMRHIPLENVRLCDPKRDKAGQVAIHPDWGKRYPLLYGNTPIEYIYMYDADVEVMRERIANVGGIQNYRGEVFYYSNRPGTYPLPIFDCALTDMSTQEAISNIAYKNARHGFLPAGCFAEINEFYDDENPADKEAFEAVSKRLKELQGDKATSSIMHVVAKDKDSVPVMVSMKGENYDKEFSVTRDSVKQNIGQAFRQPEELRCERTASGFSNDSMVQAYRVYNSVTSKERLTLEREMTALFKMWYIALDYNFQIQPLTYGSESILSLLGTDGTKAVIELAKDKDMTEQQKVDILMLVYGLGEDEANKIVGKEVQNAD